MPLKIALYPFGSRGDVQPFVPLALALQERGHDVRIFAVGDATAAWLQAAGLRTRLAETPSARRVQWACAQEH